MCELIVEVPNHYILPLYVAEITFFNCRSQVILQHLRALMINIMLLSIHIER